MDPYKNSYINHIYANKYSLYSIDATILSLTMTSVCVWDWRLEFEGPVSMCNRCRLCCNATLHSKANVGVKSYGKVMRRRLHGFFTSQRVFHKRDCWLIRLYGYNRTLNKDFPITLRTLLPKKIFKRQTKNSILGGSGGLSKYVHLLKTSHVIIPVIPIIRLVTKSRKNLRA